MAFYLRRENRKIEFLTNEIHEIKETDMLLTDDEYYKFFELQSQGKQYRLKEVVTINEYEASLFDYIEEFEFDPLTIDTDFNNNQIADIITQNEILRQENEALKQDIEMIKEKLGIK